MHTLGLESFVSKVRRIYGGTQVYTGLVNRRRRARVTVIFPAGLNRDIKTGGAARLESAVIEAHGYRIERDERAESYKRISAAAVIESRCLGRARVKKKKKKIAQR